MVIGNYIIDFVCLGKRLVVELDGRGHADQQAYDESRTQWLRTQDFRVVRFWNTEMEDDVTIVMQTILARLRELNPSPPTPLPQGERGDSNRRTTIP
jgi:very-short-patch-repair endonuclease